MNSHIVYLLASAIIALTCLASAFSFLSKEHKQVLLGLDRDGFEPFVIGIVLFGLGFGVDYLSLVAGYMFKCVGLIGFALGALILIDDNVTKKLLHPFMGVIYALVAIAAYVYGTMKTSGLFSYNSHALLITVPLVALATFCMAIFAFSFTSDAFKDRLSEDRLFKDHGGYWLITAGIILMLLAPIGALVIVTAAVGSLLATLGLLIVIKQPTTLAMLGKKTALLPAILMIVALFAADWL